ncbi:MAG: Gfo/Idh/MocA family oxidoreductase [Planctomycetota bacterium]|jgi:predicted dehydrogenase|nr:Gfo/Idh/MocA family oxidoreductase [Planctomycetota bacterium]
MPTFRAALIGCSRMGAFIDNEVVGYAAVHLPYSHAAGYAACPRTEIVACADLREDVMEKFGETYGVPKEKHYTDYKELIEKERPDIVSVATQPEHRAEIVIFAANNGVKAIYAEKALCASLKEADDMAAALERECVIFNMGTNRRWDNGYDRMKEIIHSGEIGALQSIIIYNNGTLFNTSSHTFDLMLRMNNDEPVDWVQATLRGKDEDLFDGDTLKTDPVAEGVIQFRNGVKGYALLTSRSSDYEAICEQGTVTARNNGQTWELYKNAPMDDSARRTGLFQEALPEIERYSSTLTLVEDLVHALDTGEPTRGGIKVAQANMELIFAFIESHRRGGAKVKLPVEDRTLTLRRQNVSGRAPKFEA